MPATFEDMPEGFYVYGSERCDLGQRVNEMMHDVRYTPSVREFTDLIQNAQRLRAEKEENLKRAEAEGDDYLTYAYRTSIEEIDTALGILRKRWRGMRAHAKQLVEEEREEMAASSGQA